MILEALESVTVADRTSSALIAARRFVERLPPETDLVESLAPLKDRLEQVVTFEDSWALARAIWVTWFEKRGDATSLDSAAKWFAQLRLDRPEERLHHLANGIAWATRGDGSTRGQLDLETLEGRFVLYVLLERRRFLFQHQAIEQLLDQYPGSSGRSPFLQSMEAFAMLQGSEPRYVDGMAAVTSAWNNSRDTPLASATADVCLHAIWLSHQLPAQGELLLEFCDRGEREDRPSPSIRRFRRATALRLLGRFNEAVEEVDVVLAGLSGSSEFTRTITEQCLSERSLSVEAGRSAKIKEAEFTGVKALLDQFRGDLAQAELRAAEAQQSVVSRSVEIVTFFTAAIGFAVGAINVAASALTADDKLALIAGLGLGLSSFAALIVLSLAYLGESRSASPQPGRRAVWRTVLVGALVVTAAQAGLVIWIALRS